MKKLIKQVVSFFNSLYLIKNLGIQHFNKNVIFLCSVNSTGKNTVEMKSTSLERTFISINGSDNALAFNNSDIQKSKLLVEGNNNTVTIEKNTKVYSTSILIKGNNLKIQIGERTSIAGARIVNHGQKNNIIIGQDCMFSDQIEIWASDTHPIYSNHELLNSARSITISNRVWIGSRATILKGVKIGSDAVIGMGAIVTKDVQSGTVVAGNPAKVIKKGITWRIKEEVKF